MNRIIIFLAILPVISFTQNYQTINPEATVYFKPDSAVPPNLWFPYADFTEDGPKCLRSLKLTEIESTPSSTTYQSTFEAHNDNFEWGLWYEENCMKLDMPSWIGPKIIVLDNGYNLFFNRFNDTIFIKIDAVLNEEFLFYNFSTGEYYMANVSAIEETFFLGVTDTVKIYQIQKYNWNGIPQESYFNDMQFAVSKNFGFYKVINFRDFPVSEYETYSPMEHILVSHSGIGNSFGQLTFGDIYNYEIGDIFHKKEEFYSEGFSYWYQYFIKKVIDKEFLSPSEIDFTIAKEDWGHNSPYGNYFHTIDTVVLSYDNLDQLVSESQPFEPYLVNNVSTYNLLSIDNYNNHTEFIFTTNGYATDSPDTCYYKYWFDSWTGNSISYILGCGSLYNYVSFEDPLYYYSDAKLVYFKKGEEEWGTPLDPPTIGINGKIIANSDLSIFPNPVNNFLIISNETNLPSNPFTIMLYNQVGQLVNTEKCTTKTKRLVTSHLPNGLYFIQIEYNQKLETAKILVAH